MSGGGIRPAQPFREAAKNTLGDAQMRRNLRHATTTIREKRQRAVAELPNWEALRVAGAAIKDEALSHLGTLLPRLEEAVVQAGGKVHWARDAAEACAIVAGIAKSHGAREIVKVKSIATDEIDLNGSLANEGIRAIETDLAELICQLGEDRPSHILVPAIHRNRAEVRDLFRAKLGADLPTDEPAALAGAARTYLREKFLTTKIAVSGANFAVAETGTVCVVESEGNGRMCVTLPEVLVTLMGIEKVLPRWEDAATFLRLLPRSSTAERMNPYTSFWTGVREGDGPREFHLVVLDAGRTEVLRDEVGRQTLRCIRCSACLNVCPVYERAGGHAYGSVYPGPIGAVLTPQLLGMHDANANTLPFASSLCGACYDVCPVRIDIPEVLIYLRGKTGARAGRIGRRSKPWRGQWAIQVGSSWRSVSLAWVRDRSSTTERSAGFPGCSEAGPPCATHRRSRGVRSASSGGTVDARSEILARVAASGATPAVAERTAIVGSMRDRATIVAQFAEFAAEYKANVVRVAPDGIGEAVASLLSGRVLVPADFPLDGLFPADSGAFTIVPDHGLTLPELDAADAVLTLCAVAVAETGTVVLDHGAGQGRRALTLVPDRHVVLVPEERIVDSIPEAVAALAGAIAAGRPLTWISGPSATSDIELSRVEGVHGPRRLDLIVVGD